jgi:2-oxo-4-hydroxy-4-carboxy-5-ureidoimidazoline decarboxylase
MEEQVAGAGAAEQVALIRAHPDLGTRARMSSASRGEQAGAGLDHLTLDEYEQLHRLNSAYREKFGFPFIYAVKGSTRHDILRALEQRLSHDLATEHAMALTQIYRIAQIRLEETLHA